MTETKEQMYEEAKRRMEGFEYKLECGSDTAEIWTCKRPDSSNYAFQLAAGRFGMAMFGDAGALTFGVGTYYGIEFLQHTDKHYVYEKLEQSSREKEFDEEYWTKLCVEWVTDAICDQLMFTSEDEESELDELSKSKHSGNYWPYEKLSAFVYDKYMNTNVSDDNHDTWYELNDFLTDAGHISTSHEGYTLLEEHSKALGGVYYCDYTLERPSYCAMMRLWMLHVASENIMKIKETK
jgi:hypothetical protein